MKVNGDLLGNILTWILIISICIGMYLNNWKGIFQAIGLYIFLLVIFSIILSLSNRYDDFQIWINNYLKNMKLFGIEFKWFSNGRR